jgi:AmmeMemoRadiSam system protein A
MLKGASPSRIAVRAEPRLSTVLSQVQKTFLLRVARHGALRALAVESLPPAEVEITGELFGGAFVTLYQQGNLRGCVGAFLETDRAAWLVAQSAAASVNDHRFADRLDAQSLSDVQIEISLLSRLESLPDPHVLIPGIHGIKISVFGRSGCFLPKVAPQQGWNAQEFLAACCTMKLGLPPDSWMSPQALVQLFTADVFRDE